MFLWDGSASCMLMDYGIRACMIDMSMIDGITRPRIRIVSRSSEFGTRRGLGQLLGSTSFSVIMSMGDLLWLYSVCLMILPPLDVATALGGGLS